jgi:hypothetical protein
MFSFLFLCNSIFCCYYVALTCAQRTEHFAYVTTIFFFLKKLCTFTFTMMTTIYTKTKKISKKASLTRHSFCNIRIHFIIFVFLYKIWCEKMILVGLKKTQKQVFNVLFFAVFLISTGGAWIAKKNTCSHCQTCIG